MLILNNESCIIYLSDKLLFFRYYTSYILCFSNIIHLTYYVFSNIIHPTYYVFLSYYILLYYDFLHKITPTDLSAGVIYKT